MHVLSIAVEKDKHGRVAQGTLVNFIIDCSVVVSDIPVDPGYLRHV
jgi:hypothetical protein